MSRGTPTPLSFTARIVAVLAIPLLAMTLLARAASAQEDAPPTLAPTLPAEALTFAAALEEKAPPKLLDWAKKHTRIVLRKDEFNPAELAPEKFARLFPAESPQARDAVRFLAGYEAYRRASEQQERHAARLRDLDRELYELTEAMRLLESTGAPIGSIAADQRNATLAAAQRRLEDLELQRRMAVSASEGTPVDATLRWLADAFPAVKDIPPDVLRSTRPPHN